jgi:imidazolonepropionase-like amidohydrolase
MKEDTVLITNAHIFTGISDKLAKGLNVLIEGHKIARLTRAAITPAADATVIDAKGRTLMPGLIDAHGHTMLESISMNTGMSADIGYINLVAGRAAEAQLLRGFTTVRDVGGASFGLKRAIDEGLVNGPRIYPSGAMISQTSGHGDFHGTNDVPSQPGAPLTYLERVGMTIVADGPNAVRLRAREQLRQGAAQLKLMAGGGVASFYDPLDVSQYTEAEFRAAVEAAENWVTYVTVHAYTPRAIRAALAGGVKCIEHGQLMDEASARLIAEKGVWLCLQPFLDDDDAIPYPEGSINRAKQLKVVAGTDQAYALAKKYQIMTAFGTDALFDAKLATRQGAQLAKLVRWYQPAEVPKMATANNAALLALSGERNPYPGKLGVIEEGALADILLINGNPLEDPSILANPAESLALIMKDGKIYKHLNQ